ncbi:crotonobetaine/carnitine-CoA ligase [Tamaricihabitans halophyticus]|uniref:Crotonobetaine/carnitine-CoA ligase n=1 Tax=Tamaricihabitans halophyticus TaxID=1262583 RepID=A0A4R2QWH2_9PSEU|nr:AMP-binding protein [Tamaricihabitans halophyticus]TCP53479.1 crotonobetaine/carnitine-CoA ligase [Tamaricihabitans halophyticus]
MPDPVVRNDFLRNPATHPFSGTNVWQLLTLRAATHGDRAFLIWQPYDGAYRTWTYAEFTRAAAAVAAGLQRRGVRSGQRVLIHLENCPEFLFSWFGCAAVGAVAVTTNTRSAADELAYFAEDSQPVGAITEARFAAMVSANVPGLQWQVTVNQHAGSLGAEDSDFTSLMADPDLLDPVPPDPNAAMSVQYTSGTTSRPKGVVWTHANALWGARVNAAHTDLHPDDCHLVYMPLFHANALAYSTLASVWVGARIVLVPKWSSSRFWAVSERHGCTWLSLIGLSMRFLGSCDPPSRHTYRLFGGMWCDPPSDARYGIKTIGWWGMTETISHGIVGDPYLPNRPLSMGRPAPEYGIAVVRDDGVTNVDPEEPGHLLIKGTRGLSLFAEYLNKPEETAKSFDEWGWFRTGDIVTPHADGYVSFTDRAKDMLKVGAENVATSEIERVILAVPDVAEVAVVGRPDDKLDEVPVAFIRSTDSRPDLVQQVNTACSARLADFKVPREVYVVRELPRSTINKIQKAELRKFADPSADRGTAELDWLAAAKADPSGEAAED